MQVDKESTEDIKQKFAEFLSTFNLENTEERKRANEIMNFIQRQLNSASLRGKISDAEYMMLVPDAILSLFELCYIVQGNYENSKEDMYYELISNDVIYGSACTFMKLMFTRVHNGLDYELLKSEIAAKTPIQLRGNMSQ